MNDNKSDNVDRSFTRRLDLKRKTEFYENELKQMYDDMEFVSQRNGFFSPLSDQPPMDFDSVTTYYYIDDLSGVEKDFFNQIFADHIETELKLVSDNVEVTKSDKPQPVLTLIVSNDEPNS